MELKELRKQKGITQQELAERCDLSKFTISKLEQRLFRPSLDTLERLRSILGNEVETLDWTPTREPKKRGRKKRSEQPPNEAESGT
jgi:transcriptional regulator with XRE-family HTH domain